MLMRREVINRDDIKKYVEAYSQPGAVRAAIAYYRAAFRSFLSAVKLPKIQAPVLVLWGENDTALGKELTYQTKNYCSNTCEILYDSTSGHFVQHDNPEWVNKNLLEFFSK
jgi:pimeloyl-ACP methyl ester carboxylesterase